MPCYTCGQDHPRKFNPAFEWDRPIPAILHHLWLTEAVPSPLLSACRQSFYDRHPKWSAMFHRDPEAVFGQPVLDDIAPALRDAYRRFAMLGHAHTPWGARADLLRLAALYVWGGFYVDHDLYCLRPLDAFRDDDLVLVNHIDEPLGVTEACIGCRPGDPRLFGILEQFARCEERNGLVSPRLTCWAHSYGWKTYPADYFCPCAKWGQDKYRVTGNTHAVHCFKQNEPFDLERLKSLVP